MAEKIKKKRNRKKTGVRMMLTVPFEVHAALMELSRISGVPASRFATHFLQASFPVMESMQKIYRTVTENPATLATEIEKAMQATKEELDQQCLDLEKNVLPKLRGFPPNPPLKRSGGKPS